MTIIVNGGTKRLHGHLHCRSQDDQPQGPTNNDRRGANRRPRSPKTETRAPSELADDSARRARRWCQGSKTRLSPDRLARRGRQASWSCPRQASKGDQRHVPMRRHRWDRNRRGHRHSMARGQARDDGLDRATGPRPLPPVQRPWNRPPPRTQRESSSSSSMVAHPRETSSVVAAGPPRPPRPRLARSYSMVHGAIDSLPKSWAAQVALSARPPVSEHQVRTRSRSGSRRSSRLRRHRPSPAPLRLG